MLTTLDDKEYGCFCIQNFPKKMTDVGVRKLDAPIRKFRFNTQGLNGGEWFQMPFLEEHGKSRDILSLPPVHELHIGPETRC